LFGFLPLIFLANFWNINFYLWFKPPEKLWFFVVLGFFTLALIMHKQVAKKQANLVQYPYIRTTVWSKSLCTFNLLACIVDLLGYEFMFRGWLFFPVYHEIGILWATVI